MKLDFLAKLRKLSVKRCNKCFFPLEKWSLLEWAGAACGEAGEMANVAKKIRRLDCRDEEIPITYLDDLGDEAADAIIYIDLMCARAGIDLQEVIKRKFNQVSNSVGFRERL